MPIEIGYLRKSPDHCSFEAVNPMKPRTLFRSSWQVHAAWLWVLVFLPAAPLAHAQPFRAGDIVTTNLALQNRFLWTNDLGQVFTPSNSMIRLSDFEGKIVFLDFFDVW